MNKQLCQFPISPVLTELKEKLSDSSVVLTAPPGSGKTTIVPLALLDMPHFVGKKIIMLEPRRLATRAAALRMASLLGEKVGQTVGYQIRFDRHIGGNTRIEVVTEGILTRRIQNDVELKDVGLVIFDEFHERSLHADLALALCLDLMQLRDDLRLLVMSATLETEPIAKLLGGVPVVTGHGRSYDVSVKYLDRPLTGRIPDVTYVGVKSVFQERKGDILVFLPGAAEIREVHRKISHDQLFDDVQVWPLLGDLSQGAQDKAMQPDPKGRRRVILATSIAETSLTIEGIESVVDSGWSRRPVFNPGNGLTTLNTIRVSKAAADQRAGRAGRLGPGYCLRLWSQGEHHAMLAVHPPEILSVDLSDLVLELARWGVSEAEQLAWLDPPRRAAFQNATQLLFMLGAINSKGVISGLGQELASLPAHPRLGFMLLMAKKNGQFSLACDVAAILSERDILVRNSAMPSAELRWRVELLDIYRSEGEAAIRSAGGRPSVCRRIDLLAKSWRGMLSAQKDSRNLDDIGNILVYAYPDRICQRRREGAGKYLLSGGRGVMLAPADPLAAAEYLVVPSLDGGTRDGRIFLAEPVLIEDLRRSHHKLFSTAEDISWDDNKGQVRAVKRVLLDKIVVEEKQQRHIAPEDLCHALCRGIQQSGLECLPWTPEIRQLQARVICLCLWQPQVAWPDFSDVKLLSDLSWLEPYLIGLQRKEDLKRINLKEVLLSMLGWELQQKLDRDAPATIKVPSGSRIRIKYQGDGFPVLAVRIQELFGLKESPTICQGKVALQLHLLSPAQRPVQITSDLSGFWQRSYPEVKKELKGRYPKHFWPDDPLQAVATRKVRH